MSDFHFVMGDGVSGTLLASPVADAFDGTIYTDVVSMKQYETCYFMVVAGEMATGTTTITIEACDDFTPTTTSAIVFDYKRVSSSETNTAWTAATTSGVLTTAGSDQLYVVRVKASNLDVSGTIYENVRLKAVEGTADTDLIAGCVIMMADPRYNEATLDAVTA